MAAQAQLLSPDHRGKTSEQIIDKARRGLAQELLVAIDIRDVEERERQERQARGLEHNDRKIADESAEEMAEIKRNVLPGGRLEDAVVLEDVKHLPHLIVRVPSYAALSRLLQSPRVKSVQEQRPFQPALQTLTPAEDSKTPRVVIERAARGESQDLYVLLNREEVANAAARKRAARGLKQNNQELVEENERAYAVLRNSVFVDGQLGEATVICEHRYSPSLTVRVPNYRALIEILRHPQVQSVHEKRSDPLAFSPRTVGASPPSFAGPPIRRSRDVGGLC